MSHSKEFFKLTFRASALRQGPSAFASTLPLETSVLETLYGGQFTQSIQLIKPNYIVYISHRRSTTVSLETCRLDFYAISIFCTKENVFFLSDSLQHARLVKQTLASV